MANSEAIFWIEVDKIKANPFQPRREFDPDALQSLADSIRQYGVLQPLVVTRQETDNPDGGLKVEYELIAGERRWRAAILAGLARVPALVRSGEDSDKLKLEMAIIENLQREDLNPLERAIAFERLVKEFDLKHGEIGKKVGRSREYVSNTIRILAMPAHMHEAIAGGKITEGHTRPILMLSDRPQEQEALFQEILVKQLTVREAEAIARRIAFERARKKERFVEPEIVELENKLMEKLGTRVKVEKAKVGGRLTIDFFSADDLRQIVDLLAMEGSSPSTEVISDSPELTPNPQSLNTGSDDELYNIKNFTV